MKALIRNLTVTLTTVAAVSCAQAAMEPASPIQDTPLFADIPFEELKHSDMDIRQIIPLPITALSAVNNAGQILYSSGNGRFVFIGQMYDLWRGASLDTMEDIQQAATRIYLDKLQLHASDLNSVTMGHGPTEITIFTDPLCDHCHALAQELKAYLDDYTFYFVVVPALSDESEGLSKRIHCAKEPSQTRDAYLTGTIEQLAQREPCDMEGYEKTLMAGDILGVNAVPFLIHEDGRINRGRPQHLEQWLEGEL
ncbi:DsbC family protein [Halomonas sp. 86]|uniref:DsbC family protein n=1 Tax=unclassified Halomonas TaxID=2609666 RepID=UPI0040335C88